MGFVGSGEELKAFHHYTKRIYTNLKFIIKYSQREIYFFDLFIYVTTGDWRHLSQKYADRNTILHATSFHPNQLIESL